MEGEAAARGTAERIVADLQGRSFSIAAEHKSLYHASAVMASGHLTALISASIEALAACGLDKQQAQKILFPLISSTIENLSIQTPVDALTGTFSRADVETLKRHLESLRENVSEEVLTIYRRLGLRSLDLARQQGAGPEKIAEMKKLLTENNEARREIGE